MKRTLLSPALIAVSLMLGSSVTDAADVLLVGRDPGPTFGADQGFLDFLETGGANSVTYFGQADVPADVSSFDAIVVTSTVQSANIQNLSTLTSASQGLIFWEWALVDEFQLGEFAAQANLTTQPTSDPPPTTHSIRILDDTNPLAAGLSGDVDLGITGTIAYALGPLPNDGNEVQVVADRGALDPGRITLLAVDTGDNLVGGGTPAGRRVFFPLGNGTSDDAVGLAQAGNPNLLNLLNATLDYVGIDVPTTSTQPGDFDGDGDVDVADVAAWQRGEFSQGLSQADALLQWQNNFPTPASVLSTVAVPEPSTALMAPAFVLIATLRRRRA